MYAVRTMSVAVPATLPGLPAVAVAAAALPLPTARARASQPQPSALLAFLELSLHAPLALLASGSSTESALTAAVLHEALASVPTLVPRPNLTRA